MRRELPVGLPSALRSMSQLHCAAPTGFWRWCLDREISFVSALAKVLWTGPSRCRLDQLAADANTIAAASNAAVEQITRIQKATNFCGGGIRVLEWEAGGFRDDEQVRKTAERGNDVFGDPVAEEIVTGIAGQVFERQHRHRRTRLKPSRRGERRHFNGLGCRAKLEQVAARIRLKAHKENPAATSAAAAVPATRGQRRRLRRRALAVSSTA